MNAAYIEIDGRQILTYETEDGRIYQLGSLYHTDLYEKYGLKRTFQLSDILSILYSE